MINLFLMRRIRGFKTKGAQFARDAEGVAAVEFAIIALVMVVMLFGVFAISSMLTLDRKVTLVAQTASDLVSRYKTVNTADFTSVKTIVHAMLYPRSETPLKFAVSEIWIDSSGNGRVQWSWGDGAPARAPGTPVPVPATLIARDSNNKVIANQYLIYSEAFYDYTPVVNWRFENGLTFKLKDDSFTRPRLSVCVQRAPKVETDPCPTT